MNDNIVEFMSKFPEDLYLPSTQLYEDYNQKVCYGLRRMRGLSVRIGFMVRDVETILPFTIARCRKIGSMFKSYEVFAYENDSNDRTPEILKQSGFVVKSEKLDMFQTKQDRSQYRREKMAFCRNQLRDMLLDGQSDYIIILDGDIIGGFSYEGVANSFAYDFDVMASNSIIYDFPNGKARRLYYDSWAFRELGHPDPHRDQDINPLEYHRGELPLPVISAFGGLAVYSYDVYNSNHKYDQTDCDHVTLHKKMIADGTKVHMNPSQIVLYNQTRYSTEW